MHIITIINQKGGVAKTTTAHAIATGLHLAGKRVLAVDLDGQQNLTNICGGIGCKNTAYEVLTGKCNIIEAIIKTSTCDMLPASEGLSAIDTVLKDTGKEYKLKEALVPVKDKYDFIIIDSPPALGVLSINGLTASNEAVIPAQADIFSLQAIKQLQQTIEAVQRYTNSNLRINGVIITRYNNRAVLSREAVELINNTAGEFGTSCYNAKIRECIAIKEAQARRQSIFEYAPKSNGATDYKALITEIVERESK